MTANVDAERSAPHWAMSRVHHIGLTVSDIERSVAFYRDMLGLTVIARRETNADYVGKQTGYEGVTLKVASLRVRPDSEQSIEMVQYVTHGAAAIEPATNRPGSTHLCFEVNDLRGAYEDLRRRGVQFKTEPVEITSGPNQGGWGVYFYDPDRYVIELHEPPRRRGA